ncbi:MAG: hypothetical protein L0Z53_15710 [Acidobacteriales bacterium]|nr:hypothetical protein [Terriglobales bacterium]
MRQLDSGSKALRSGGIFRTTHWSVVLAAKERDSPEAGRALEQLCQTYWPPLYAYIRHHGHTPEEAEDLRPDVCPGISSSSMKPKKTGLNVATAAPCGDLQTNAQAKTKERNQL